ncbi:1-aminocyclopropane-1-carboxylate deaminase [Flavobacterium glycines]|uniref:1-aminocyclopropane-1-carboxylate deaminase n=1 Tax=Flavobacterium glycines TaxID=551990 RepID=A0A1B9DR65_9FLAO|nr:pyridoxal-phosphate dependent enzyme [Flavobacterium glycines]OCB72178.1 1-aminocyclopropane-1-carboxylate deaminase [Flavobacterium glycines]GEL09630.1 1-aminocyclopropane-1-carboxylate deaminase [Flavobacterium glycines]SDI99697.1 1-aminocyclopropane-1-carboxylate deaminase [Flavobacterium glycines]
MNQELQIQFPNSISITIKREDLLHPVVSGNKFRKLKYNLLQAKAENKKTLLTFGGAFSNHIAAVAFAAQEQGLQSIGIIRGDELGDKIESNPTLQFAQECGMQLEFVSREDYRLKKESSFLKNLEQQFGDFYLVPEGGTNALAIKGCQEILTPEDSSFDYICCAVGTGGTISGIINSALPHQKVLGFPALKGDFLQDEIRIFVQNENWELITDYHFGGYGKVNEDLIRFINQFYIENQIPLDPVYTGKMVFGIMDLIQKNYFPVNSNILLIHTGGLQGIFGMNAKLKKKQLPTINIDV